MTPLALALVLAAALCHASWNLVAKRAGGGNHFVLTSSLMVTVLWSPVVVWLGVRQMAQWGGLPWAMLAASALVHVFYYRCLLHGYAVSDLSVVYPVARGSGPLMSALGAVLLLHERMSATSALGAVVLVAGVFLIAGGPGLWRRAHERTQRERVRRGVAWGALTGVFIAGYTVIDGYAVKVLLISPVLVDYVGNVLRVPMMLPFALRDPQGFRQALRTQWRAATVIAVLGPASYIMVLYAVRMAPLSHVAPAREVSMLVAAVMGGTLLGEGDRAWRLAGAACITAGVAALAWG